MQTLWLGLQGVGDFAERMRFAQGLQTTSPSCVLMRCLQPQRRLEEGVLPKARRRREVALVQTEQRHVACEDIAMTDRAAAQRRRRSRNARQVGVALQRHSIESQTGMRGAVGFGSAMRKRRDRSPVG